MNSKDKRFFLLLFAVGAVCIAAILVVNAYRPLQLLRSSSEGTSDGSTDDGDNSGVTFAPTSPIAPTTSAPTSSSIIIEGVGDTLSYEILGVYDHDPDAFT